jgi:hypothetical protein
VLSSKRIPQIKSFVKVISIYNLSSNFFLIFGEERSKRTKTGHPWLIVDIVRAGNVSSPQVASFPVADDDAVLGWNLNVPVKKGVLWNDPELTLNCPSVHQGIPAVLDDCIPFRWKHPVADRAG